jgi:O-antigen/teichoic acid export membrane protein
MNNKSKYTHVPAELFLFNKESAAKFRSLRFKYAVATSLGSKVTTSVVQLVALPIAVKALGTEQFALYAMLAAAVGWLGLVNIGVGPVLTVNIASAAAQGDNGAEKRLLASALIPILFAVCITGIVVYLSVYFIDVAVIFGNNYSRYPNVIRIGVSILAGFALLQIILSVVEAAQSGYQEQYKQNLMAMSSNIFSIGAIIAAAIFYPTVIGMILAVNIFPFLFRVLNAFLVFRKRPFLIPSIKYFNFSDCKSLLYNGFAFSMAGGLGNFLCHIFPVVLVGRILNANSSTSFAVAMNALIIASGILSMVNIPLWPAISDSLARADIGWARRAYYRTLIYSMGYALIIGVAFFFF